MAGWDKREGPACKLRIIDCVHRMDLQLKNHCVSLVAVFYVDSEGACIEGNMFCVGSGSQLAYAILDTVSNDEDAQKRAVESIATSGGDCEESTALLQDNSETDDVLSSKTPHTVESEVLPKVAGLAALSLEKAISTAVKAVRHATYRDGFSGGYINVLVVNETGIHHVKRVDSKTIPL